jgi:hypothetical protein
MATLSRNSCRRSQIRQFEPRFDSGKAREAREDDHELTKGLFTDGEGARTMGNSAWRTAGSCVHRRREVSKLEREKEREGVRRLHKHDAKPDSNLQWRLNRQNKLDDGRASLC